MWAHASHLRCVPVNICMCVFVCVGVCVCRFGVCVVFVSVFQYRAVMYTSFMHMCSKN